MVSCPGLCCRALLCFPQDFKKSLLHKELGYWCLGEHGEKSVCRRKKLCPEKTTARGQEVQQRSRLTAAEIENRDDANCPSFDVGATQSFCDDAHTSKPLIGMLEGK